MLELKAPCIEEDPDGKEALWEGGGRRRGVNCPERFGGLISALIKPGFPGFRAETMGALENERPSFEQKGSAR